MTLVKLNDEIQIGLESKSTRNGFKHVANLYINGREYESVKICYLNRTWERYCYESVLQKLLSKTKNLNPVDKIELKTLIERGI